MAVLVGSLEKDLLQKGVVIHGDADVVALGRTSKGWTLLLDNGVEESGYSGIVLAIPAYRASGLVESFSPDAARLLRSITYSSVAVITLQTKGISVEDLPEGTGYIVPADGGRLVSACTFLSKKWPHIATQGSVLLRASTGRYGDSRHLSMDDEQLTDTVVGELENDLQLSVEVENALVVRWENAFPQYRVGHLSLVAQIAKEVGRAGPASVAGAAYGGVGIPACIKSGYEAASSLLEQLRGLH
jgi:oxygen-dependent protoporphyrinogen oxidase